MNPANANQTCNTICTFSFGEKLYSRTTFILGVAIGAYGLWLSSPILALAYLAYAVGSYLLLMHYTVCARCPHLFVAGDCLFIPAPLARIVVSQKTGPLRFWELVILAGAVFGTAGIPAFWLLSSPILFGTYIVFTGGTFLGLIMRICKKCQVTVCPINRNPAKG